VIDVRMKRMKILTSQYDYEAINMVTEKQLRAPFTALDFKV